MRLRGSLRRSGAAVAIAALAACRARPAPPSDPDAPLPDPLPAIAARVNDQPILGQYVKLSADLAIYNHVYPEAKKPRAYRETLQKLIDRELLLEEAVARGITADEKEMQAAEDSARVMASDKEWVALLAQQGMTEQGWKLELRSQYTVKALLEQEAQKFQPERVTDDEVQRFYRLHPEEFTVRERYRIRHILIKVPAEVMPLRKDVIRTRAEHVLVELRSGADFAKVAQRKSEDRGSAGDGGLLPPFGKGEIDPRLEPLADAAASLKPGGISDVIETKAGFHIVKLEEKLPGGVRPLADVADDIRAEIVREQRDTARDALLGRLRAKAKIEIYL